MISNLYGALSRGGAERVVQQETDALVALGHEVGVVSGEPKGCALPRLHNELRVYVKNIAFYGDLGRHNAIFRLLWHVIDIWSARSTRIFAEIFSREKPDVVHTHNVMGLGFGIFAAVRRAGMRHVHTVHDVQLLDPSGLIRGDQVFHASWLQRAYIAVMRRKIGSPQVVIFPSAFLRDLHVRYGFFSTSRHVVLRNPAPQPASPRTIVGSPARFLFVGQLEPHKGIALLLHAWEKKSFFASLEIIGGGSMEKYVRRRAENLSGVHVRGRLDRSDVDAAYDRADWIVVPSTVIENAPTVLMEALGRGVPAVASAVGGIPELVHDEQNGFLTIPGDLQSLVIALEKAAVCGTYRGMSARAVAVVTGLDVQRHTEQLREFYVF